MDNHEELMIQEFLDGQEIGVDVYIDIFKVEDEYYISEVNPRFGGGYPHAYEWVEIFIKYINNNLNNIKNTPSIGNYIEGIYMIKHDNIMMLNKEHLSKFKKLNEINEGDLMNKRIYLTLY